MSKRIGRVFVFALAAVSVFNFGFVFTEFGGLYKDTLFPYSKLDLDYDNFGLRIPQALAVNTPQAPVSRCDSDQCFIGGTSNPRLELRLNGCLVPADHRSRSGLWGVFVDLVRGRNVFEASQQTEQGEEVVASCVMYNGGPIPQAEELLVPATQPEEKTLFYSFDAWPKTPYLVRKQEVELVCDAPTGADVWARIADQEIQLAQGDDGKYRALVDLSDFIAGKKCKSIGKIVYTVTPVDGESFEKTSEGSLYYLSEAKSEAVFAVSQNHAVFCPDAKTGFDGASYVFPGQRLLVDVGDFFGSFGTDSATGRLRVLSRKEQCYVPISGLRLAGVGLPTIKLRRFAFKHKDESEELQIKTNASGADCSFELNEEGTVLRVRFPGAVSSVTGARDIHNSAVVKRVEVSNFSAGDADDDDFCTVDFVLQGPEVLGGYNVRYPGKGKVVISLKNKPRIGSAEKPLEGLTVLVDPGHGGCDPGTIHTPLPFCEADVNLGNSLCLKAHLKALGARVLLTREGTENPQEKISWDERLKNLPLADLFISVHANSNAPAQNGHGARGFEVWYVQPPSAELAQNVASRVPEYCGLFARGAKTGQYKVVVSPRCPAILTEVGFMSSPREAAKLCSKTNQINFARAVCDSVLSFLGFESGRDDSVGADEDGE